MRTSFTSELLLVPETAASEAVIRKCVHCGFCTATCPTYVLLGDELDSPRGRIYLIKEMLETEALPSPEVVRHVDRCLSCLSCMTTCPSGVNYMHLVDHARAYIERHHRRPFIDRAIRMLLAAVMPYPRRFRAALWLARLARPIGGIFDKVTPLRPLAAMLRLAPKHLPSTASIRVAPVHQPRVRVALLQGCAEPVLRPAIRAATVRVLARAGYETVFVGGESCCGALVHHMGREEAGLVAARNNIDAWYREHLRAPLDAILVTASGCGTMIKDYGFILRDDPLYADRAAQMSGLSRDISEFLAGLPLSAGRAQDLVVAYHGACSLQHGQKITEEPKRLLAAAGFTVRTPKEAHLCCGCAGIYNIHQPDIAGRLGDRKVTELAKLQPDIIATGNIGCAVQIGQRTGVPVLHIVELIDWAQGGPRPESLPTDFPENIA